MIPTKFRCIWRSGFREDFQKSTSQKQGLPVVAMLANESRRNEKYLYRGSSMEAFYQISVHLTKWFQRTFFRNQPIRNNNQGLIHLAKQFQRRFFFRNQPIRTKNGLWRPGLLTDQDEMSNFYRGPSIDASYQVFVYLPKWFQRRLTNQKQELPLVALFVNGSGRNQQSLQSTFHRCFLPCFLSFGQVLSEKIFLNLSSRNKNCLWRPCLLTDQDELSNLYRGPSIDASYQVSIHLAKWFQRFLEIDQLETRIAYGGHVC